MIENETHPLIGIEDACLMLEERLLGETNSRGFWEGRLSSSALATAVAVFALARVDGEGYNVPIRRGLEWLAKRANSDGGWGDSPQSKSNLSTTVLCWAVIAFLGDASEFKITLDTAESWLTRRIGSLDPDALTDAILSHYGDDYTFSVPILTMCALAGRLGPEPGCWKRVPQLPMELAILPHRFFAWLRMPVVSYAIPALIAIGMVRHCRSHGIHTVIRFIRKRLIRRLLRILEQIQPVNGGFLEATPLTAFVTMSLASAGRVGHPITTRSCRFLVRSQREDGSWPIDTNLATWCTTLAINGLSAAGIPHPLPYRHVEALREWLVSQQFKHLHPFTRSAPGGWGWTDLPGGVPDADDTSGALIALRNLEPLDERTRKSAMKGIKWLLDLTNKDGGIPTFCRGWGRLPFDRSCADITAHALRAYCAWIEAVPPDLQTKMTRAMLDGIRYLTESQAADGSWTPLWFGNQDSNGKSNPTYGTSRVLAALQTKPLRTYPGVEPIACLGRQWLLTAQNPDGGWGGAPGLNSTVEETALALDALADSGEGHSLSRGTAWLIRHAAQGHEPCAAPIGLYFASLWYSEKTYPIVFSLCALYKIRRYLQDDIFACQTFDIPIAGTELRSGG